MAVTVIIGKDEGERRFTVAPYNLRELRAAAPFIEDMNDIVERLQEAEEAAKAAKAKNPDAKVKGPKLSDLFALTHALCEILAIGISKIDAQWTADKIEAETGLEAIAGLQDATRLLLEQSGLASKGEAKAPLDTPEAPPAGQEATPALPQLSTESASN